MDNITVKTFSELNTSELYDILYLRAKVFVVEQECAYLDLDYADQKSLHCLLYEDDSLLAYARVIPAGVQHKEVSIGRVVTSKPGNGYGRRIFAAAMEAAKCQLDAVRIEIASQTYISHLYEEFGFRAVSDEYILEFRPHITMIWEQQQPEDTPLQ